MANELQAVYTTGATSPAIAVRNSAGNTWNGSAYVASSTLTTAAWQAILVAASELMTGDDPPVGTGLYVADMPAGVPAGTVSFVLYVGTEPVESQPATLPGSVDWNGTSIAPAMEATLANIITAVGAIPTNTLSSSDARLANLDAAVSSRLATTGYTPPPTATEVAQAVLQTDLSTVEDAAAADSLCTVCLASLHSSVAGTTWTIRKTDGTTMVTKTVAVSAGAEPIVGVT